MRLSIPIRRGNMDNLDVKPWQYVAGIDGLQWREMSSPAERVRQALLHWLETTSLTQRQFAADLEKSQAWLDKILTGVNAVRLDDLDAVAHAMHTTAAELVREETDRYQLELTPTEVRLIERLRHRPDLMEAIAILLDVRTGGGKLSGSKRNIQRRGHPVENAHASDKAR